MSENKIQVWNYESSEIRTVQINGEPWFVLADVCKVLELSSPHKVAERLDGDEKGRNQIPTLGGVQEMAVVNESGLYTVILRSDKPQAKPFRKWVTSEVLPSIRKHGSPVKGREEILPKSTKTIDIPVNDDTTYMFEGYQVRTAVDDNGNPLFCGIDVAKVLGYSCPADTITRHCKGSMIQRPLKTAGGVQQVRFITEGDLYRLIVSSKLPSAQRFERWVFDEVLPSIRKHGAYMTPETIKKVMLTPDFIISLAGELKNEQEKNKKLTLELESKDEEISTLKPKATYCDLVLSCTNAVPISLIAKDYGMSARKLNSILNDMKIQYKCGGQWILNQNYAGKGYTKSATHTYNTIYGTAANIRTNWTQKGRLLIYEKLKEQGTLPLMEQ